MRRAALASPIALVACVAFVALVACSACTTTPAIDRRDVDALVRAEDDFSDAAAASGVRAAFLAAMAPDAILFRPGPVNGPAFIAARPDPAIRLSWRSQRVAVSASGELGYSSGPYRLVVDGAPDRPSYGQFLTVWRRTGDGRWQVLVDQGIGHPGPDGWSSTLDVVEHDAATAPVDTIAESEAAFAAASAAGAVDRAYEAFASTRVRFLRDGLAPLDAPALVPSSGGRWTWSLSEATTARSRDLGWATGRYRERRLDGSVAGGHYVRVWRAERGYWKILGEVLAPLDEAAP